MEKNKLSKKLRGALASLLTASMLAGPVAAALPASAAALSDYKASYIQQHQNLAGNYESYLDSSVAFKLPDSVRDDEEISVIVTIDGAALMDTYAKGNKTMSFSEYATDSEDAKALAATIAKEKKEILSKLDEKGISYTVGEEYNAVVAGFELLIKAGDFETTCKSLKKGMTPIVGEVYNTCETELVENKVNVFDTGIFNSEGCGYDGSGMVVAVLDTGLDSNHTAFSVDNFTSQKLGLTYNDVAKVVGDTAAKRQLASLTVDDVYVNEKVPYGFDYADNDPDVFSTHNNHGTHVAGVIVGNDDVIRGVAPNAQVVPMKIFSDTVDTSRTAWILAALEDCVVLGVDVINMSIGTACGFSRETDEEAVGGIYDKIRAAGISMVVAASNSFNSAYGSEANGNLGLTSNPDTGTVGSPSTYEGAMSVASIAGAETPYLTFNDQIIYFLESSDASGEENEFVKTLLGDKKSLEIEYVLIPGVGRSADYTGIDVKGKIALVRRGSNTFEEKALIAEEQGCAGLIVYNNVSGDIKMNVGDAKIAVCSISQNDGEMLAAEGGGTIVLGTTQTSGPFISDFSSWGPTPDLRIKPEITAHGGSILSSITGGGYDRISGTSMACPNLSGVVILLRQYVVENFPDIANDNNKVNEMVNRLIMSTADIALNKNGLPYAVRKQGAGLANLQASIDTKAYLSAFDKDGNETAKPKLELGDDPDKTGVYEMTFSVNNFGDKEIIYYLDGYVLTEGVSETKTNAGKTTVTEEAYELEGATIKIVSVENGTKSGSNVKVPAGSNAKVTVKITLSKDDKKYLNDSFENGMYVEGFLTLTPVSGTEIDLNIPYLAFYGDWTVAPLFDLTYYDTNADELDDGIDPEDKTMADAYPTVPIGAGFGETDDYINYMGSYYFIQDPSAIPIPANKEYISLSNQQGAVNKMNFIFTGMLRNAARVDVTITNDVTGEVIFEVTDEDVRKSYSDGGPSIYPANVEIYFDSTKYNLENNTTYTMRVEGFLDYGEDGGAETNKKNVYEFPITVDFQAPTVTDVQYRYEYDKTLKKNRLYADVYVYDNHYTMSSQLGYVTIGEDENGNPTPSLNSFGKYMTPVYSDRNSTTKVTYELTDYIYDLKNAVNKNSFVVNVYDYALNYATYEIGLPDNFTDFYFDGLDEGLTLSVNEVFDLVPKVTPDDQWSELLTFTSQKNAVARVVNNKLVATGKGVTTVKVQDPITGKSKTFTVTVLGEGDEGYEKFDKPVADVFRLNGFYTNKAYFMLDSKEKLLGDTGSTNFFDDGYRLEMYPSESVALMYTLNSYFPDDTTVAFESSNENIVKIDDYGTVTAMAEGYASVTIKVMMDGKSTYYSETVSVEVKDPYINSASTLTHYYGNGGLVNVPTDLSLKVIGAFCFANFDYIPKTEEELAFDDRDKSKQWFIGDNTITKVVLPEGIEKIDAYAFANLTALEEIVLPSTLEAIEYGAFYGCTSLKKITFSGENNLKIISQSAFEMCDLRDTLNLPSICVISAYAFAGNQKLEGITLGDTVLSVGQYAFAGCKALKNVKIDAAKVKYGAYAFTACESLESMYVNSAVIPEGMFYECKAMNSVTIGPDVNDIGAYAFRSTEISSFNINKDNKSFKVQTADHILSSDGTTLIAVAPSVDGEYTEQSFADSENVTTVGKGAFSHNQKISTVALEKVTVVEDYGFYSNKNLTSITLGDLTSIGAYAFYEAQIDALPSFNAETEIGEYAFAFTNITSVEIPDGMTIAEGVFSECAALQTIVIGNDVTIGDYAFNYSWNLCFEPEGFTEGDTKYFRWKINSPITSLTIGTGATIGESAFHNAASLESITLGEGAKIGNKAFYNTSSLKEIDLSKVIELGDYALSGDVYNVCMDDQVSIAAVTKNGEYIFSYHAAPITSLDLSGAESIGEYAFAYLRELTDVKLGEKIKEIPKYAFAGCTNLKNINLEGVETVGEYSFMECGLEAVDLSGAKKIEKYSFVYNILLSDVKLGEGKKTEIGEGAFSYDELLATVDGMAFAKVIGDYAFAYTAITSADLSGATEIGKNAFIKNDLTEFTVTLSKNLEKLGDNPFAMCKVAPFFTTDTVRENGKEKEVTLYDFDLSRNVFVVDGSLYCKNGECIELITFAGVETDEVVVADGTDRISALAFAGSDVKMVKFPYTTVAIGHKAFYACENLEIVVFNSYTVPVFEEEFDPNHYNNLQNIPGSGDYGNYTDYDGETEVTIVPLEIIPYFMWNSTGGMYSNVFYGANFVDYIGHVDDKLMMVRPVNGECYDSFICNQYFDLVLDGPSAPDASAVAAIDAINAIPKSLTWEDRHIVEAARKAYDAIATIQQQALVTNYNDLITAEQRIAALAPKADVKNENKLDTKQIITIIIIAVFVLLAGALIAAGIFYNKYKEVINASVKAEKAVRDEKKADAKKNAKAEKAAAREMKKADKIARKAEKKADKEFKAAEKVAMKAEKAAMKAEKKNNKKKDGGKDEAEN